VTCFDEDLIMDDLVGMKEYRAYDLCSNIDGNGSANMEWLHLHYKSNKSVEILVELRFIPNV
jgi:hypothetical protein